MEKCADRGKRGWNRMRVGRSRGSAARRGVLRGTGFIGLSVAAQSQSARLKGPVGTVKASLTVLTATTTRRMYRYTAARDAYFSSSLTSTPFLPSFSPPPILSAPPSFLFHPPMYAWAVSRVDSAIIYGHARI